MVTKHIWNDVAVLVSEQYIYIGIYTDNVFVNKTKQYIHPIGTAIWLLPFQNILSVRFCYGCQMEFITANITCLHPKAKPDPMNLAGHSNPITATYVVWSGSSLAEDLYL